ncbi:hypothetical protein NKR23_g10350 [Pleurostoma richardsiae]|uniref:Uncharacterized protein n=1 Tax=Pleurostoma richardsiae TaxID=41990 RepID=A0AA38VLR6_9PEZI|nr:hypothetical protein NKR23_g10350 [Pleurostoma richardsiae]
MLGYRLGIALLGLVITSWAAPTPTNDLDERQGGIWIDPPSGTSCDPKVLEAYGICIISPPITTIKPSDKKRQTFELPPDPDQDLHDYLAGLEVKLEQLQNKPQKNKEDRKEIERITKILKQFGIEVSAPPGTTTTITPRDQVVYTIPLSGSADFCSNIAGLEIALEGLMQHEDELSDPQYFTEQSLKWMLATCGVEIVKSPDGTITTLVPGKVKERDTVLLSRNKQSNFDLAGLEKAYEEMLHGLDGATPSYPTAFALQYMATVLEFYGISINKSPTGTTTTLVPGKRQGGIITLGCSVGDVVALKAALATLTTLYGDPRTVPQNIFLIEQNIVSALQYCNQTVPGWTTLTPGNPIPGGPLVPDPTVPGGPITPDPTVPGGPIIPQPTIPGSPIIPSDRRRAPSLATGAVALLQALQDLETHYGEYDSMKADTPVSVFIIMQNIVTTLQISGIRVPGWPILPPSTTITVSS